MMEKSALQLAADRAEFVITAVLREGVFIETERFHRRICVRLNSKGMLRRDAKEADRWYPAPKLLKMYPGQVVPIAGSVASMPAEQVLPALVESSGPSELAVTIRRAQSLFNDGDYEAALYLSEGAYDHAKAAANYGRRMKASDQLILKAHEMQAAALKIAASAQIVLANQVDEAQAAGFLATKGRPKNISDENILRLEDFGLTTARLHEARKLRDAENSSPGLINRVIDKRVEEGLEPSRANLRAAVGTASASKEDRGANFYQTPTEATRTLLAFESFTSLIWEPACGLAAVSRVLEDQGYDVRLSDLHDRGATDRFGDAQAVGDFLLSRKNGLEDGPDIVTNPPYGEVLNDFVAHALREHRPRKMALLLNLNFLCGFADEDRNFVMDDNPPARIYIFKRRLPMMHREGYDGKKASSRMNTAWFVWERQDDGSYGTDTIVRRVDWHEFADIDAQAPGAGGHIADAHFVEDLTRDTPRKTIDERLAEERDRATAWVHNQSSFSRGDMRRGIGVRDAVAEALISEFVAIGAISAEDSEGRHAVLSALESEAA